ncbi:Hypothetical predicted protein, partial [Podarcis lilfordi]
EKRRKESGSLLAPWKMKTRIQLSVSPSFQSKRVRQLGDIEADDFSVIPNLHHHRRRLLHHLPPQQFPAIHRDNFQRQRGWQECYVVLLNEIQSYEVCVTTRVN